MFSKDDVLVFTPDRNYTAHQFSELLTDAQYVQRVNCEFAFQVYAFVVYSVVCNCCISRFPLGSEVLKTLEGSDTFVDPGVDVFCIHGSDIPTAAQFR